MDSTSVAWVAAAMWRWRWVALLVLVGVLVADGVITWQSPRTYLARSSLLIGPSTTVDPGQLVYSVDALGRSMIVGTYANVLDTDLIRTEALQQAGVTTDGASSAIDIKASVLADSALVQVTAVASDPGLAATIANAVGQIGRLRMRELYPMYDLTVVTPATPPTAVYRPDIRRNLSVGILLGVFASGIAACALQWWTAAPGTAR